MRRAGLWRIGLRSAVLRQLATLGRDPEQINAYRGFEETSPLGSSSFAGIGLSTQGTFLGAAGGLGGADVDGEFFKDNVFFKDNLGDFGLSEAWPDPGMPSAPLPAPIAVDAAPESSTPEKLEKILDTIDPDSWDEVGGPGSISEFDSNLSLVISQTQEMGDFRRNIELNLISDGGEWAGDRLKSISYGGRGTYGERGRARQQMLFAKEDISDALGWAVRSANRYGPLFPVDLPSPPRAAVKPREPKSHWPAEAQELSRSLQTAVDLAKVEGGLIIEEQSDSFHAHRQRLTSRSRTLRLESADAWLTRQTGDDSNVTLDWCTDGKRGAASLAYELALVRSSTPADLHKEYDPNDWWRRDLSTQYQDFSAEVQRAAEGPTVLILKHVLRTHEEIRFTIDDARHAVLSIEWREFGKQTGSIKASDLVEIAGVWLPQRVEHFDEQGRRTHVTTRKFEIVNCEQLADTLKRALDFRAAALTIQTPLPSLSAAQKREREGKASLEDRVVLLISFVARQRWDEAHAQLAECEKLMAGKSFAVWTKIWLLTASRRNEELRQTISAQAQVLSQQPRTGDLVLTNRVLQAAQALAVNERLALLRELKPVFARQPEHTRGLLSWSQSYISALHEADRDDEYLAAERELAAAWPDEAQAQISYANHLAADGDYEAAYAWLKQAIDRPAANWPKDERDSLYDASAELLKEQGRYADLAPWIGDWAKLDPSESNTYELLLAALEADELLARWLRESLADAPLDSATKARREAAVETAIGDNGYLRGGQTDPKWFDLLSEFLLAYVERDDRASLVWSISQDSEFRESDQFRAAGRSLITRLKEQADSLPPDRLANLVDWLATYSAYFTDLTDDEWRAIAAKIRARWQVAEHPAIRSLLAQSLLQVLGRINSAERLVFLRQQLGKAGEEDRAAHARALFDALLEADWSPEIEAEAFALIDRLASAEEPADRLLEQVSALYRWTDRMAQARYEQANSRIEHPEKLTRSQLAQRRKELLKEARTAVADLLKAAAGKRMDGLKPWLDVERLTLEIQLEPDLPKVVEACWELLGPLPPPAKAAGDRDPLASPSVEEHLSTVLRSRLMAMLLHLATRKEARPEDVARLEKALDELIARDPDDTPC
jgi:hypothetical protein